MAHEHEFYKGEKLFDYLHYRNCRFVRFVDNGKNSPKSVALVECGFYIWKVPTTALYQYVPNRVCSRTHSPICYEHHYTEDNYPYFCPMLEENLFEFETERI